MPFNEGRKGSQPVLDLFSASLQECFEAAIDVAEGTCERPLSTCGTDWPVIAPAQRPSTLG